MTKWISVTKKLPPLSTSVLCRVKNHVDDAFVVLTREQTTHDDIILWLATFVFKSEMADHPIYPAVEDHMVTHWMKLPKGPID